MSSPDETAAVVDPTSVGQHSAAMSPDGASSAGAAAHDSMSASANPATRHRCRRLTISTAMQGTLMTSRIASWPLASGSIWATRRAASDPRDQYRAADEWASGEDAALWDGTAGDGL